MKNFLFALLLFLFGSTQVHSQSLQTSNDINLVSVGQASQQDSLEVELTFNIKDLTAESIQILIGAAEGSGQYAVIHVQVKEMNGNIVQNVEGVEKNLTAGKLVVRKRMPNEASGQDVHIQVSGKDKTGKEKYKVSKQARLN